MLSSSLNCLKRLRRSQQEERVSLLSDPDRNALENLDLAMKNLKGIISDKNWTRWKYPLACFIPSAGLFGVSVYGLVWIKGEQKAYNNSEDGKKFPAVADCDASDDDYDALGKRASRVVSQVYQGAKTGVKAVANFAVSFVTPSSKGQSKDDTQACREFCTRYDNNNSTTFVPEPSQTALANAACPKGLEDGALVGSVFGGLGILGSAVLARRVYKSTAPKDQLLLSLPPDSDERLPQIFTTMSQNGISTNNTLQECIRLMGEKRNSILNTAPVPVVPPPVQVPIEPVTPSGVDEVQMYDPDRPPSSSRVQAFGLDSASVTTPAGVSSVSEPEHSDEPALFVRETTARFA